MKSHWPDRIQAGRLDVLDNVLSGRKPVKGWIVNRYFGVVRYPDDSWNLVHLKTGVRTHFVKKRTRRQVVTFARAATKRFSSEILQLDDRLPLIAQLRAAGSEQWSKRWWKRMSQG